jgi:hypothetical protein
VADDDHVDMHLLLTVVSLSELFFGFFFNRLSVEGGWRRLFNIPHDCGCCCVFEVTKGVERSLETPDECSDTTAMMRRGAG